VITYIKILEVFANDSLARLDNDIEMKKDEPRRTKEMQEQAAKADKERKEQMAKDEAELKSSGEMEKELKEMENYLASKKISAQKTGRGTYVQIQQQGSGPDIIPGDTLTVKYTGRKFISDSVFQSNTYTFPVGRGQVIHGWDEGLVLFKKGGKGTIFIPGFLAYGKNPPPGSPFKPFEALVFDVEIIDVKK
jgi:FKBP-type peptidyl-prolyl cis-trans isomerase